VRVDSAEGQFLGWASFSPTSKIRARMWSFDEKQRIDAFFRPPLPKPSRPAARDIQSDGVRLVHGESDGCPA
jgi:23S rRNA (cytosine1962-C5)-methyltransferase